MIFRLAKAELLGDAVAIETELKAALLTSIALTVQA